MQMQIWLNPITHPVDFIRPLCAVITRIENIGVAAGYNQTDLTDLTYMAAMYHDATERGERDLNIYADEVRRLEFNRLQFPTYLKKMIVKFEKLCGNSIEWCLPFMDADIYYTNYVAGLDQLRNFPQLRKFMVFDHADDPLAKNFKSANGFSVVTPQEINTLCQRIGFPRRFEWDQIMRLADPVRTDAFVRDSRRDPLRDTGCTHTMCGRDDM
jgi:hypothetical protein